MNWGSLSKEQNGLWEGCMGWARIRRVKITNADIRIFTPGGSMLCVRSLPKLYKLQNGWPGFGFEPQN